MYTNGNLDRLQNLTAYFLGHATPLQKFCPFWMVFFCFFSFFFSLFSCVLSLCCFLSIFVCLSVCYPCGE